MTAQVVHGVIQQVGGAVFVPLSMASRLLEAELQDFAGRSAAVRGQGGPSAARPDRIRFFARAPVSKQRASDSTEGT